MFCAPRYVVKRDPNCPAPGNAAHSAAADSEAAPSSEHSSLVGNRFSEQPGAKRVRYLLSYEPGKAAAVQQGPSSIQGQASAIPPAAQQVPVLQHRSQRRAADAGQPRPPVAVSTGGLRRSSFGGMLSAAVAAAAGPGIRSSGILTPYPEVPHAPVEADVVAEPVLLDAIESGAGITTDGTAAGAPMHLSLPSLPAAAGRNALHSTPAPPSAAAPAAAQVHRQPCHPAGYWEDRYQLPYAALRSHWPDPAMVQLLTQQSDCLYDFSLPAVLPPATAAALEAAAAAGADSNGIGQGAATAAGPAAVDADAPALLPLTIPQSLQSHTSSSSGRLSGAELMRVIRDAAAGTAAVTSAADAAAVAGSDLPVAAAAAAAAAGKGVDRSAAVLDGQLGPPATAAATAQGTSAQPPPPPPPPSPPAVAADNPPKAAAALANVQPNHQHLPQQQLVCPGDDEQLSSRYLLRLACPQLMVGHQSDCLQVPHTYLPLWRHLGLSPFSPAKSLMYTALVPSSSTMMAAAFFRDLAAMYCSCNLGVLSPLQPTDGPPLPPAAADAYGLADATAAALIPVNTAASSSSTYGGGSSSSSRRASHQSGPSQAGMVDPAAQGNSNPQLAGVSNSDQGGADSCWLRNLAAAARSLQARLLLQPPDLLFPAPWVVASPDLTQPQEASVVVFVVVPDSDQHVEGVWQPPAAAGLGQQQQQQRAGLDGVLALKTFETVARYLAPVVAGQTYDHHLTTPDSKTGPAAAAGSLVHEGAAAAGQQQQQCGTDVVIQLVRESVVLAPTQSALRGLAMSTYLKVRRRRRSRSAADVSIPLPDQQQQQQSSQPQQQSQLGGTAAMTETPGSQQQQQRSTSTAPSPTGAGDSRVLAPWVMSHPTSTTAITTTAAPDPLERQLMYEPLFTLATAAAAAAVTPATADTIQQPEEAGKTQQLQASAADAVHHQQQQSRTLHCCYHWLPPNGPSSSAAAAAARQWLVITWADDRTELLKSALIQIPHALLSPVTAATAGAGGDHAAAPAAVDGISDPDPAAAAAAALKQWVCLTVLTECLSLAADISSSVSCDQAVISRLLITRLRDHLADDEAHTWQQLLTAVCHPTTQGLGNFWGFDQTHVHAVWSDAANVMTHGCAVTPGFSVGSWQPAAADTAAAVAAAGTIPPTAPGLSAVAEQQQQQQQQQQQGYAAAASTHPVGRTGSCQITAPQQQQQQQHCMGNPELCDHAGGPHDPHTAGPESARSNTAAAVAAAIAGLTPPSTGVGGIARQLTLNTPEHVELDTQQQQQQQHKHQQRDGQEQSSSASVVWGELLLCSARSVAAVAAAAAAVDSRRSGSSLHQQQRQQSPQQGLDHSRSSDGPSVLSSITVASVVPDGPLYIGNCGSSSDLPQGMLLLQPGLEHPKAWQKQQQQGQKQQPQQQGEEENNSSQQTATATVIIPAAAAGDSLVASETDTARLLHVSLLAAATGITPPAWSAAAATLTGSSKSVSVQPLSKHGGILARQGTTAATTAQSRDRFGRLTISVPDLPVDVAAATPTAAGAAAVLTEQDLSIITEGLVRDQLSPGNPSPMGLSPGALQHLDSPLPLDPEELTPVAAAAAASPAAAAADEGEDGEILDLDLDVKPRSSSAEPAADAGTGTASHQQQQDQLLDKPADDTGTAALASSSDRRRGISATVAVAAAATKLAALSVAGLGLRGLLGYNSGAAVDDGAAAVAAATGSFPSTGSVFHLPLHAAVAWRLWLLAAAMDHVAT